MTGGKLGLSTSVAGLMLLGSVLAPSSPASAQIRLIPQVGLYVPQNDLGRVDGGSEAVDVAKKESTLGYGASLELGASGMLGLRIGGVYGSQSDVAVSGVGCSGCAARSTVIALTGALVLRPLPSLPLLQPYLLGGAGVRRYDFDLEGAQLQDLEDVLNQNKLTWHLGVGSEIDLGLVRLIAEVSDYFGEFDLGTDGGAQAGEKQHDFFVTVGLIIG